MRIGGPVFVPYADPQSWVTALQRLNYRAAYCPDIPGGFTAADFAAAAQAVDIVIAEVGVWNNPLSRDESARQEALRQCQEKLALADEIGARCCVNIAGSRGPKWDGPDANDLTLETFNLIVESVRQIIDAVKPQRTFYTLETMPWMYPDSTESYQRLLAAIDRPAFGVHFDPVNLICSPQRYFNNGALMREFVDALGPHIKSVHAKDIILRDRLTTHLDEACPGLGVLDYRALLTALAPLDPDLTVMVEHLPLAEDYAQAVAHIRGVAADLGVVV